MNLAIKPQHLFTALMLAALTIGVFSCGGGGGGKRDSGRDSMRDHYARDPDGYRKKWGV